MPPKRDVFNNRASTTDSLKEESPKPSDYFWNQLSDKNAEARERNKQKLSNELQGLLLDLPNLQRDEGDFTRTIDQTRGISEYIMGDYSSGIPSIGRQTSPRSPVIKKEAQSPQRKLLGSTRRSTRKLRSHAERKESSNLSVKGGSIPFDIGFYSRAEEEGGEARDDWEAGFDSPLDIGREISKFCSREPSGVFYDAQGRRGRKRKYSVSVY